ncbi:MAG: hypothetical protein JJ934_13360 [Pseudomonadales bacterium]|nr:hypothetical protein [Pseudomonadales bacterium]MBO6565209.1 hypothetical protein [Pseudomonadales bacterium]MBO6597692.1 hypothetical protein [Pseudomonadales bacterium]MBO6657882.1 hypothetical protein [Pseudomonadales bacterium]MBO6704007.1 hypothetical protein [Pseudomonadales bacterium]
MVKIVGNVKPEDDFTHPLGPEQNFNESVYFNFFDRQNNRGGFIRMGNRANEGYAEMTVIVFNSDGSAFFNYKKPEISNNDEWNAGGARVQVLAPGEKLRTTYQGSALHMANPRDMQDPGKAFKNNPFRKIDIDLFHEGVGPLFGHVGEPGDGNDFARAHYEQHMRVSGSIKIEGEPDIDFNGHGLRDHSWGPRYWQSIRSYRWITGNFGDDLGMVLSVVGDRIGGMFHRGEEFIQVKDIKLEAEYEEGTNFHRAFKAQVSLDDGSEHRVEGQVKGFVPLRNRRSEQITYIGEGMTEYTLDGDRVGYGLSEFLNQPGDEL